MTMEERRERQERAKELIKGAVTQRYNEKRKQVNQPAGKLSRQVASLIEWLVDNGDINTKGIV